MLLTAPWVLPVSSPPLPLGAVLLEGERIIAVGPERQFQDYRGARVSLTDQILLPGLVNAHAHLEFPKREGLPRNSFTQWVKALMGCEPSQPAIFQENIRQLLLGGTTTLANHMGIGAQHPPETDQPPAEAAPLHLTPLRTVFFLEVLGSAEDRARASLVAAHEMQRTLQDAGIAAWITPHSLYAVHPNILEKLIPVSTHFLESLEEEQWWRAGTGPLAEYVRERDGVGAYGNTPLPTNIIVHGNYLNPAEMDLLRKQNVSVIHCPGSHRFFGHRPFPLQELTKRGINVALGTDSLASNDEISMLRELALARITWPDLAAQDLVTMATQNGAKALRMETEIGSLSPGKKADLIAVPCDASVTDPYEMVLRAKQVSWMMINGKICILHCVIL